MTAPTLFQKLFLFMHHTCFFPLSFTSHVNWILCSLIHSVLQFNQVKLTYNIMYNNNTVIQCIQYITWWNGPVATVPLIDSCWKKGAEKCSNAPTNTRKKDFQQLVMNVCISLAPNVFSKNVHSTHLLGHSAFQSETVYFHVWSLTYFVMSYVQVRAVKYCSKYAAWALKAM